MSSRPLPLALLLLSMAAATTALAGRPLPAAAPVTAAPRPAVAGTVVTEGALCRLGVTDPAASIVSYIYPDDDQYYTLIDPADCAGNTGCGVMVTLAHAVLDFVSADNCPVRVGIVQADLTDPECPVPLPGQYLCEPLEYELVAADAGVFDFGLPLSGNTALTGPAFLEITFTGWSWNWQVPNLVLTGSCETCRSYNYWPGDQYDLCTFGFDGNPLMSVESECANPVAVERATWGAVKSLYR